MAEPPVSNQAGGQPAEEQVLVARARAGEPGAFDALILRCQQPVYAVALRMLGDAHEAQDVAQDAFVRAYRGLAGFRGEARFSTWVLSITMNLCRNRRRWWARRRQLIGASLDDPAPAGQGTLADEVADPARGPADIAAQRQLRGEIMAALRALDQAAREVIVLRDLQGLSYEEIGQALRLRVGTVKSRLSRARLALRAQLNGKL
jgi:RNA polymerase sigma-70 factor (ECF subfamily)